MHAPNSQRRRGYTLTELIVVLMVLAVLAALLVPSLTGYIDKARQNAVIAKARAVLVAAQAVVTQEYGAGRLKQDATHTYYESPSNDDAHYMAKEILALAETTQADCEWRFSLASAGDALPQGAILRFEYCDKTYRVAYSAVETEDEPAGWGTPERAAALPKADNRDAPPFLSSDKYDPDHFHPAR